MFCIILPKFTFWDSYCLLFLGPNLPKNDVIIAVTSTGGTPVVTLTYANAASATAVDVVDGLTVTATDSD